jgi:LCP family protein required for cell wall assembly
VTKRKTLVILLIFTLVVVASGVVTMYRWNAPLGPSLDLPTRAPVTIDSNRSITAIPDISAEPATVSNSTITSTQTIISANTSPVPSPTAIKQPLCAGPATMTILLIGSDQRGTSYLYGLADSIYVIYIDFTTPKVMVIDFPRDLWVEIPDISDHYGITHGKINQAYLFGNPGMGYYDGPGEGPGLLAQTLYLNFGLIVDHYVAIDTHTFVKVIDAVGGVDINLKSPIDISYGVKKSGLDLYLSAGPNHLDGERALIMATNRIPSTFQRMKYQRIIFSALREKMLSSEVLPKIPQLATQYIGSVRTDLSPSIINKLICISQAVPKGNIQSNSFPEEMFTATVTFDEYRNLTTYIQEADFDQIRAMMADFMNGIWPFPEK